MSRFIGGPLDGQNIRVPNDRNYYEIAENPRFSLAAMQEDMRRGFSTPHDIRVHRYEKQRLAGNVFAFVLAGTKPETIFARLLQYYSPPT